MPPLRRSRALHVRADVRHEELAQARRSVGEAPDGAGGLGHRQQGVQVHPIVDEELQPAAAALEDGDVGAAVDPAPVGAVDVHLEVAPARGGLEVLDRTGRDDATAGDDDDVLADVLDEVELVAGEQDADAGRGPFLDDLGHRRDADRVQAGERLVHDQQLRLVDERGRELDPLLVAVRQLLELGLRPIGQAHPLQPAQGRGVGVAAAHAVLLREVAQLLGDPHPRIEAALLGHVAEAHPRVAVDRPGRPSAPRRQSWRASPKMQRIVVVLPAPFGPRKPTIRPGAAVNDAPSRATTGP